MTTCSTEALARHYAATRLHLVREEPYFMPHDAADQLCQAADAAAWIAATALHAGRFTEAAVWARAHHLLAASLTRLNERRARALSANGGAV